ncbi:MAG: hypothetical protein A3I09_01055 [Deltaproteobacteria bacterium RIFCSPLOWO2_02_FULL_47_10]|nr:MAG: hypothetical protein A3I09_01055 [Deltaproteobacteria bacterium RIFCSPLOWO2_02_FULL_47_10]
MKRIISFIIIVGFCFNVLADGVQEPFDGWHKLDLNARQLVKPGRRVKNAPAASDYTELFIKTSVKVKKRQKKEFDKIGFKYGSIIPAEKGAIVTGRIKISEIPSLAGLDFVVAIETGIPLSQKVKNRGGM